MVSTKNKICLLYNLHLFVIVLYIIIVSLEADGYAISYACSVPIDRCRLQTLISRCTRTLMAIQKRAVITTTFFITGYIVILLWYHWKRMDMPSATPVVCLFTDAACRL